MKSVIERAEEKKEIEYPCLMENNGTIVLFTDDETGMVLADESGACYVGEHSDNWATDNFNPFTGKITLSNGE